MIYEVDEALRGLIRQDALPGTDVEVVFDAPTKDWASRRNAPTIDVYLYDIREDLRRRDAGPDQRVRRGGSRRGPAPAAPALQALLPRHRLDAAPGGRAPAAVRPPARASCATTRCRPTCSTGPLAELGAAGADHRRPAAAGGPRVSPTSGRRSAASSSRRWTWCRAPTDTGQRRAGRGRR